MKKTLNILLVVGSLFLGNEHTYSQNELDVLRYSNHNYSGTARFNAMGGAFTALGGDYSGVNINPAGLGIYRSSEFTITPSFLFDNNDVTYEKGQSSDGRLNFNLGDLAYVNASPINNNGWKSINFSIGYSRTASFSREYEYRSTEPNKSSIINAYVDKLNSTFDGNGYIAPDQIQNTFPLDEDLAYKTYLIDPLNDRSYEERFFDASNIDRSFRVKERGGMGDIAVSLAANYSDKLYIGGSIGFINLRYRQETFYNEKMSYNTPPDSALAADYPRTTGFERKTNLDVDGSGINLKAGFIYRLIDNIRLGASIQSPTYLNLTETYILTYDSKFVNGDSYSEEKINDFSYRIQTPWRTNAGIGIVLGKKAILSVDYEYVNYPKGKIKDDRDATFTTDFSDENTRVKRNFDKANNYRAGIEYRINDPFSFRAGFKYNGNPLNDSQTEEDLSSKTYSAGLGYKDESGFFIDATYSLYQRNQKEFLMPDYSQSANIDQTNHLIQFTVGARF